ncbi:helix-turn-helix transcriptional regulator [Paenibacillus turicensis]|uniref:helix-turn-helix domain-containing protein n=1 Tax=Paenibacillus turicensis TaxID=160487 RepID=UPI003D2E2DD7
MHPFIYIAKIKQSFFMIINTKILHNNFVVILYKKLNSIIEFKEVYLLNLTPTIRTLIQDFLKQNHLSMNKFADSIGMNVGAVSNIISGKRSISVKQLDQITAGMGLEEGYFYSLYTTEIFEQEIMDWRKIKPLLKRCADLHRLEDIERIVQLTLENLTYIPLLFDIAELFFNEGKHDAAILLYKGIAESEKNQHSERLALCQFRLFWLRLNDDQENNLLLATQFEPYIERLEEVYQLEAFHYLLNTYLSLSRWDKTEEIAKKLLEKATKQYKIFGKSYENKLSDRPLIFYILYSYLSLGDAYFQLEEYDQALNFIKMYTDVEWVSEPNSEEKVILQQFQEWANANQLLYQLMAGHVEVLSKYVEYINTRENEQFIGMYYIVIAANKYNLDIDNMLSTFQLELSFKKQVIQISKMMKQVAIERYTNILRELGIYYLNKGQLDTGIQYVIESLESAIKINNKNTKLKCITAIFEISLQHEEYTTNPTFKNLMNDVLEVSRKS